MSLKEVCKASRSKKKNDAALFRANFFVALFCYLLHTCFYSVIIVDLTFKFVCKTVTFLFINAEKYVMSRSVCDRRDIRFRCFPPKVDSSLSSSGDSCVAQFFGHSFLINIFLFCVLVSISKNKRRRIHG